MKKIGLLFIFFLSLNLSAQDTIRTAYFSGKLNEVYVKDSAGEKNGSYVRYSRYGKKFISGQYQHGLPSGIWEYYSADTVGTLVQKLNFDTHQELFVDSARIPALICGPRYFGGNMLQQEYIQYHIRKSFSLEERNKYKGLTISVELNIDPETMKPMGVTCIDPRISTETRKELIRIISSMPAWLPPVCKSDNQVWRFTIVFAF
jgi:hypothetical protein